MYFRYRHGTQDLHYKHRPKTHLLLHDCNTTLCPYSIIEFSSNLLSGNSFTIFSNLRVVPRGGYKNLISPPFLTTDLAEEPQECHLLAHCYTET